MLPKNYPNPNNTQKIGQNGNLAPNITRSPSPNPDLKLKGASVVQPLPPPPPPDPITTTVPGAKTPLQNKMLSVNSGQMPNYPMSGVKPIQNPNPNQIPPAPRPIVNQIQYPKPTNPVQNPNKLSTGLPPMTMMLPPTVQEPLPTPVKTPPLPRPPGNLNPVQQPQIPVQRTPPQCPPPPVPHPPQITQMAPILPTSPAPPPPIPHPPQRAQMNCLPLPQTFQPLPHPPVPQQLNQRGSGQAMCVPVAAPLPAIINPITQHNPVQPPLIPSSDPFGPTVVPPADGSIKLKKKKSVTCDEAEFSGKKKKEIINAWIRHVLSIGIEGLKKEYQDSPNGGSIRSAQVFVANPTRNRYTNIPCCDATRVKIDDDPDFYIHANIVSSAKYRRIICAQAPLKGTIEEFWRMILSSGVEYIVMLCEIIELGKEKSANYFPSKLGQAMRIGKFCNITKVQHDDIDKVISMSLLRITREGQEPVFVKHVHWHNWPDHGVPESYMSPLHLLNIFRSHQKPILIHCSAGVGRTGTLALILIALQTLRSVDFSGIRPLFTRLREERFKAIQTEMQYLFVHRCVLEYLVQKKYNVNRDDYTKFLKEYKVAEKISSGNKNYLDTAVDLFKK